MEKYRGGNIMREILCFGDSNTYGYIPGHYEKAPARYPWGIRWTSLLNEKLGKEIHHRRLRRHVNSVCCSGRGQRRTDGDCVGRTGVRGNLHRPRCG